MLMNLFVLSYHWQPPLFKIFYLNMKAVTDKFAECESDKEALLINNWWTDRFWWQYFRLCVSCTQKWQTDLKDSLSVWPYINICILALLENIDSDVHITALIDKYKCRVWVTVNDMVNDKPSWQFYLLADYIFKSQSSLASKQQFAIVAPSNSYWVFALAELEKIPHLMTKKTEI